MLAKLSAKRFAASSSCGRLSTTRPAPRTLLPSRPKRHIGLRPLNATDDSEGKASKKEVRRIGLRAGGIDPRVLHSCTQRGREGHERDMRGGGTNMARGGTLTIAPRPTLAAKESNR